MNVQELQTLLPSARIYERSLRNAGGETYAWAKDAHQHYFLVVYNPQMPAFQRDTFSGEVQDFSLELAVKWCLPSTSNARKLRTLFPWTAPQPLGLQRSFGFGDRLGLANAAQIRAARDCGLGGHVGLVLAQQSIREMARTQRRPDEVLDAATWAVFQEGWKFPWGADADHLKTPDDARKMAAAGFTFFTIDPSAGVNNRADEMDDADGAAEIEAQVRDSVWEGGDLYEYETGSWQIGEQQYSFDIDEARRAIVKYGRAVAIAAEIARAIDDACAGRAYEIEVSVDETESPTTPLEHLFFALELQRRGVQNLVSLAPRFVGEFQKGIDYKGNIEEFRAQLRSHAAIAKAFGYKLSVHSGSDKFSVYPILGEECGELLHVKTAGTWWLEALRALAQTEPRLFAEIVAYARERFPEDRTTYHVVEDLRDLPGDVAASMLDHDVARQMLHVSFGSVLSDKDERGRWRFRDRIYHALLNHEDAHFACVEEHARKHLQALGWCEACA